VVWEVDPMGLRKGDNPREESTAEWDDSNWREEYKAYTSNAKELDLLENGPKSLSQSWYLGALRQKWMKIKGYKYPDPPDVSSSMKEFFEKTKDQGI
tara:strand:+ start:1229 stop:1519 length:291 start_codon:yes stop_codon:yes gene_type:complete